MGPFFSSMNYVEGTLFSLNISFIENYILDRMVIQPVIL